MTTQPKPRLRWTLLRIVLKAATCLICIAMVHGFYLFEHRLMPEMIGFKILDSWPGRLFTVGYCLIPISTIEQAKADCLRYVRACLEGKS